MNDGAHPGNHGRHGNMAIMQTRSNVYFYNLEGVYLCRDIERHIFNIYRVYMYIGIYICIYIYIYIYLYMYLCL